MGTGREQIRGEQMALDIPERDCRWVAQEHGEVFTRRWVVELILDLAGYTPDRDLAALVAVEPSCGTGAFLTPMVERLVSSCLRHGRRMAEAATAIRACDLMADNVELATKTAAASLIEAGVETDEAARLACGWVRRADFLLDPLEPGSADFVLGNPPYVRLERVPRLRQQQYRAACRTMRRRSDLYVGFIERGLSLLRPEGVLAFIVADRWMRNQYGEDLRALVSGHFAVEAVVALHDVDAFEAPVAAYPAITVLRSTPHREAVMVSTTRAFGPLPAQRLSTWVRRGSGREVTEPSYTAARLRSWSPGAESWPSGSPAQLELVADLERRFPPLEDPLTGTRVGIGVATGADSVYLTTHEDAVEPERLLPLVMAGDTVTGGVLGADRYLVNPWRDGHLVPLEHYPRLRRYFAQNEERLRARHVARRNPRAWYRTIDRVEPGLLERRKLLLPDLKASIHPVLEEGRRYPHHNLYFVTSTGWDLEVLGGLLLSEIANLFVGTYCVKMRGGCYRFQAQYLRRIRVPLATRVRRADREALATAFAERDVEAASAVAARLYGFTRR